MAKPSAPPAEEDDGPPAASYTERPFKPSTAYRAPPRTRAYNPLKRRAPRASGAGKSNATVSKRTFVPDDDSRPPPFSSTRGRRNVVKSHRSVPVPPDEDGWVEIVNGAPKRDLIPVTPSAARAVSFRAPSPSVGTPSATSPGAEYRARPMVFKAIGVNGAPPRLYYNSLNSTYRTVDGLWFNNIANVAQGPIGRMPDGSGIRFMGATRPRRGASAIDAVLITPGFDKFARSQNLPTSSRYASNVRDPKPAAALPSAPLAVVTAAPPSAAPIWALPQRVDADLNMQLRMIKYPVVFWLETFEPLPADADSPSSPAGLPPGRVTYERIAGRHEMRGKTRIQFELYARVRPIDSAAALRGSAISEVNYVVDAKSGARKLSPNPWGVTYSNTFIGFEQHGFGFGIIPPGCLVSSFATSSTVINVVRAAPERDLTRYGIEANPGPFLGPFPDLDALPSLTAFLNRLRTEASPWYSSLGSFFSPPKSSYSVRSTIESITRATGRGDDFLFCDRLALPPVKPSRRLAYGLIGVVIIGGVCYYLSTDHCWSVLGYCKRVLRRVLFISLPDYSDEDLAGAVSSCSSAGTLTTPENSLRATVFARVNPLPLTTASDMDDVLWRAYFGGRCLISLADAPPIVYNSNIQIRRTENGVVFYGSTVFRGEFSDAVASGPPPAEFNMRDFFFRTRKVLVRPVVLPSYPGLERIRTYDVEPGPWHYCWGCCSRSPAYTAPVPVDRFGHTLITVDGSNTHLCWHDYTGLEIVPSQVLHDAVTRWSYQKNHAQYASLGVTLNLYPDCVGMVIEAVANGYRVRHASASAGHSVECIITDKATVDPDRAQSIVSIHNPLLPSSKLVPGNGLASLLSSLETRVHNPPTRIPVSVDIASVMAKFADCLVRGNQLYPLSFELMSERMKRPTQQQELEELSTTFDIKRHKWTVFNKTEPSTKEPRIIVCCKGTQNFEYARWTIPLSDYLMRQPFWMPGKSCGMIQAAVQRLHCIARKSLSQGVSEYDYTGFDATTGAFGITLLKMVFRIAFGYDVGWEGPLSNTINQTASVSGGTSSASMGIGTLSGSADTTLRNTLLNAFVIYLQAANAGLNAEQAYSYLCTSALVSGDDSLVIEVNGGMVDAATACGLTLEGRRYTSGPTRFLGRFYPDPWGSSSNVADVARWLSRMHLITVPAGKSTEAAMSQRALGHLVNDPDTPLLSDYAKRVLTYFPSDTLSEMFFDSYHYSLLTSVGPGANYRNDDFNDDDLMTSIALDMNVDITALTDLRESFLTTDPRPGAQYPILGRLKIKPISGLVVNGVPYVAPRDRPSYKITKEKRAAEAAALLASDAVAEQALAKLDLPINPLTPPDSPQPASTSQPVTPQASPSGVGLPPQAPTPQEQEVAAQLGFLPDVESESHSPEERRCDRCKEYGHKTRQCPTRNSRRSRGNRGGGSGH